MKTMNLSACASAAVALLCFGFLWWNSGTITYDPVHVVKVTPCQYRQSPTSRLLPGTSITYQRLGTGRLYDPTLCASEEVDTSYRMILPITCLLKLVA